MKLLLRVDLRTTVHASLRASRLPIVFMHGTEDTTADIAQGYNRDCFAFPGRVGDEYSKGCNNLILRNGAALITSADDFLKAMRWDTMQGADKPVQRQLFVELSPEEERVLAILRGAGDALHINNIVVEADIPIGHLTSLLFSLEMKGLVRTLAGARYTAVG